MSDLSARQPMPVPGRQNVLPRVIEELARPAELDPSYEELAQDVAERTQAGIKKYGTQLQTHNGRDAYLDLLQELVDAIQYAAQAVMEDEDAGRTSPKMFFADLLALAARARRLYNAHRALRS